MPGFVTAVASWTTLPSSDGTRFTNDGTGHGMFVSVENVAPFWIGLGHEDYCTASHHGADAHCCGSYCSAFSRRIPLGIVSTYRHRNRRPGN
jgi:hypothetical protein